MKASSEARVGAVVLLAAVALGGGYVFLSRQRQGGETYHLVIKSGVATIRPGSDVMFRGVKIGEVRKVALDPDTQDPLLTLAIQSVEPPIRLMRNYEYTIRSGSFIGENYVDIRNGAVAKTSKASLTQNSDFTPNSDQPSDIIIATAPGGFSDFATQATVLSTDFQKTLALFDKTLNSLNNGVLSSQTQLKLARTLDGVAKLSNQASKGFGDQGIKFGLGDPQAQRALTQTLQNTSNASREASLAARNLTVLTQNAGNLTRNLSGVVDENRSQLRGLLTNFNETARNISGLTESLAFVVNKGGFKENSQIAFRSLRRAAENVEIGTQGLRSLGNAETQATLRETIVSIRDATGALRDTAVTVRNALGDTNNQKQLGNTLGELAQTAQSLHSTVENLNQITGALKNVAVDPQTQSNLKETFANLNGTLAATRAAAERVNVLIGGKKPRKPDTTETSSPNGTSPNGTPTSTPDGNSSTGNDGDGAKKVKLRETSAFPGGIDFTLRNQSNFRGGSNNGHTFGDLTLNAKLFNAPFRLGLANIGEGSDLTLQTGQYVGKNAAVRYGLYRGKLGLGAELRKGRFSLEGNLYDPNRRSYNAYAGFALTPKVEILAGQEKRGSVRSNSIAVRLRP